MFDRLTRSYNLLSQSLGVLRQDPELLLFPLFSALAFLGVGAAFIAPAVLGGAVHAAGMRAFWTPMHLMLIFTFYVATYFVVAFFNVALMAGARIRLEGGDPTVGESLRIASTRTGAIFAWVVLAATVGTALHLIEEQADGFIGRLVTGILGTAWSVATAMAVPVLAFENVGPVQALQRSVALMKQTWGEELAGNLGLGLVTWLGLVTATGVAVLGFVITPHAWVAWAVVAGGIIGFAAIVQSALHGIFQTAVYAYATSGQVPPAFSADLLSAAYRR